MSELHFFMSASDTEQFIAWLIDEFHPKFILDRQPTVPLPSFTTLEEIRRCISERGLYPRFFLLSDLWQRHPLSVSKIDHIDGHIAHHVNQRYGGPAFDFLPSREDSSGSQDFIVNGWFSDYATYYVRRGSSNLFKRPSSMTHAFQAAQRYMRRNGQRTKSEEHGHAGGWALAGALAGHAAGTWLRVGDLHFHPVESQRRRPKQSQSSRQRKT